MTDLVEHLICGATPFRGCQQIGWTLKTVRCALGTCDNYSACAVRLLRTVIEPIRAGYYWTILVIIDSDRPTEMDGVRIALCIRIEAYGICTKLTTRCAVINHMATGLHSVVVHGYQRAKRC